MGKFFGHDALRCMKLSMRLWCTYFFCHFPVQLIPNLYELSDCVLLVQSIMIIWLVFSIFFGNYLKKNLFLSFIHQILLTTPLTSHKVWCFCHFFWWVPWMYSKVKSMISILDILHMAFAGTSLLQSFLKKSGG